MHYFKRSLIILTALMLMRESSGQNGGDHVFSFLNLTTSARVTSLGGSNVSLNDNNLNLAYENPALLNDGLNNNLALNYVNYIADINYGMALYSRSLKNSFNMAVGITYLNYGSFSAADPNGVITGKFNAAEYAFSLILSYVPDSLFSFGINLKPVLSHLERYTSYGIALDAGGSWHNSKNNLMTGLIIKNAGIQLKPYAGEPRQRLPFEIIAGITHKLEHAPFRLSMTFRNLQTFDLSRTEETVSSIVTSGPKSDVSRNILKHLIPGVEFSPHKNFYLSAGYNFRRSFELKTSSGGTQGFTWGFGILAGWIDIEVGRAAFHTAGASTNLSLILRTDRIYKRNRVN